MVFPLGPCHPRNHDGFFHGAFPRPKLEGVSDFQTDRKTIDLVPAHGEHM